MTDHTRLGIDIGGSGIKGAIVDCSNGTLLTDRLRVETPTPATPETIGKALRSMLETLDWRGPVGCTFPAVIDRGVARTAANVHSSCKGVDLAEAFSRATEAPVLVLNDADAAGVAEYRFGAAKENKDLIILLTFGTGIGSAVISDGRLIANTEFGHLNISGGIAEHYASNRVRKEENLTWIDFADRVSTYLRYLALAFNPDLFVIGGGVSNPGRAEEWIPLLDVPVPVSVAQLANSAGLVGAADVALNGLDCEGLIRPI